MKTTKGQCHVCFKVQPSYWRMPGPEDCNKLHCGKSECFHKCWNAILAEKIAAVPQETKQRVLDLLHEGKTIGEVQRTVELDTLVMGGVITENIEHIGFDNLRRQAK